MKNEQQIFEEWKRANKKGLNEGFLDGDEEKPVTSDDSTGEENLEELSNEDEKNSELDISARSETLRSASVGLTTSLPSTRPM